MNLAYFRKSKFNLEETIKNCQLEAEKAGFKLLGEADLDPEGKMLLLCRKDWAQLVIKENYQLLGFLPCSISIFKKEKEILIGSGQPSIIKAIAANKTLSELAEQADKIVKNLINQAAGVGELKPKKIKLYSTMSCPYCKMEKAWLEEKQIKHDLVFVDLNQKEAEKMVEKTGQMGVPVTEIEYEDGEAEYIVGFDKARLSQILGV